MRDWKQKPISPDVREKALEILRTQKGTRRFKQVEKLLGHTGITCMPFTQMAVALGLTTGQFHYLIDKDRLLVRQKRQRASKKDAADVTLTRHICHELRFTIELPQKWKFDYVPAPYSTEKQCLTGLQYLETMLLSDFHQSLETDDLLYDPLVADRRKRLPDMRVGLFRAWPSKNVDSVGLTLSRLELDEPMTSLDLYECAKPHWRTVATANRPPRGINVDGLPTICYQYVPLGTTGTSEMPIYLNVYFTDMKEGWIFSFYCRLGNQKHTFEQYRPLFQRIARSLKRVRTV